MASNVNGTRTGVATRINEIESRDHLTHCFYHALKLAAGDTIKAIKIMRGTPEAAFEFEIKYTLPAGTATL